MPVSDIYANFLYITSETLLTKENICERIRPRDDIQFRYKQIRIFHNIRYDLCRQIAVKTRKQRDMIFILLTSGKFILLYYRLFSPFNCVFSCFYQIRRVRHPAQHLSRYRYTFLLQYYQRKCLYTFLCSAQGTCKY